MGKGRGGEGMEEKEEEGEPSRKSLFFFSYPFLQAQTRTHKYHFFFISPPSLSFLLKDTIIIPLPRQRIDIGYCLLKCTGEKRASNYIYSVKSSSLSLSIESLMINHHLYTLSSL